MSHSNVGQTNLIGTHESVYGDSPVGKLDKISLVRTMTSPLHQGFEGNVLARISVGIDFNSAVLASEQGIVSAVVSLPNSTAVGAELGRMPCINDVKCDILVKASLGKILFESEKRNPHNFPIEMLSLRIEPLEILNGDVGIIPVCHLGDVSHDFADAVLHEVVLIPLGLPQCPIRIGTPSIGIGLKDGFAFKNLPALDPNILAEVVLMQNFSVRRKNRDGETFAVHINPKDILPLGQFSIVLGKICDNLETGSQSISLAVPSILKKIPISLKVAVLANWNGNRVLGIDAELHEREGFIKDLAIARNIEFDGNPFGFALASPDRAFNVADNLRIKRGASFAV